MTFIRWAQPMRPGSEEDQKTRRIIGQQVLHITGMYTHQLLDGREVLIEQQLHAWTTSWLRSRSAA